MVVAVLGLTGVAIPASAATVALPTAVFAKTSDWGTGFEAAYTITNAMSVPLNTWTLTFTLPANEHVTSLWNGTLTMSGDLATVRNADYNRNVAVGASTTFGLVANGTATTPTLTCTSP